METYGSTLSLHMHEHIRSYIMTWAYTCSYVLTKLAIVARSFLYEENSGLATIGEPGYTETVYSYLLTPIDAYRYVPNSVIEYGDDQIAV